MTARIRPMKEGKYRPSLVIGEDDPFKNTGTNYFATVYGALTKGFSIAQGDRLAVTAGYYIPLNDHSIKDGPFGGIPPDMLLNSLVNTWMESCLHNLAAAPTLKPSESYSAMTVISRQKAGE